MRFDGFWVRSTVKSPNSLWVWFQYSWSEAIEMWEFIIRGKNINTVNYLKINYIYIFISCNFKITKCVTKNTGSVLKGSSISSGILDIS